jgi:galactokinase
MSKLAAAFPPPAQQAAEQFPIVFQDEVKYSSSLGAAWAPGRVNLIGEHTDYNDGFVLPIAVNRVTAFAGRARADRIIRLWSSQFQEQAQISLDELPGGFESQRDRLPTWTRYVLGVITELLKAGICVSGFDAVIDGDVPLGGGMSSSAAIEVAAANACALFSQGTFTISDQDATLTPMQVAAICQRAEHSATGLQSGILDQSASCLGQPGKAILLDCRSLEYKYVPFDVPGLSLVLIDTGVRRELASSAYNERRKQCEEAAQMLRDILIEREPDNRAARAIQSLRDITQEDFFRYGAILPEVLRKRAGYVISENARVLETVKYLREEEYEEIGLLLWLSHAGLRYEYEVSSPELDALVDIAKHVPGVLGGRMMGGGFGGCTINLVRNEALDALRATVEEEYQQRTGRQATIDICKAAGGPGYRWTNSK